MMRNGPRDEGHIYTIKPDTPDERNVYSLRHDPSRTATTASSSQDSFELRGSPPITRLMSYDSRESLGSRRGSSDLRDSPGRSRSSGYDPPVRSRMTDSPTRLSTTSRESRESPARSRPIEYPSNQLGSPTARRYDSQGVPNRRRSDFARHDSPGRGSTESLTRNRYTSSPRDMRRQYSLELRDSPPPHRDFYGRRSYSPRDNDFRDHRPKEDFRNYHRNENYREYYSQEDNYGEYPVHKDEYRDYGQEYYSQSPTRSRVSISSGGEVRGSPKPGRHPAREAYAMSSAGSSNYNGAGASDRHNNYYDDSTRTRAKDNYHHERNNQPVTVHEGTYSFILIQLRCTYL